MRSRPSCDALGSIPLIDQAPINPLDPIACGNAIACSEGQGRRRPVFRMSDTWSGDARPENISRRRSLALGRSEHDGRLMAHREGGARAAVPTIVAMITVCVMITVTVSPASSDPAMRPAPTPPILTDVSPDPWAAHIAEAAKRFVIPERWIRAVMVTESGGDRAARSPKGAIGLMQIMPATWAELRARYGLGNNPYLPRDNILAGAAYLREMHDRYGSMDAMLAAYNTGPARYDAHLANGRALPAETANYVAKIASMIDGTITIARTDHQPSRPSWSRAPLFVARSTVAGNDDAEANDRPSVARMIVDLSALVPPSDGLFPRRP